MPIRTALFAAAFLLAQTPAAGAFAQSAMVGPQGAPGSDMEGEGWQGFRPMRPHEAWDAPAGRPGEARGAERWRSQGERRERERAQAGLGEAWRDAADARAHRSQSLRSSECWAQVRHPAQFAPPPSGPEYVWRRQPGPAGSPGPIWCLSAQPFPSQPVMIAPERYGWVRVLCDEPASRPRIAQVQRRLKSRGLYRGEIHGRYDEETSRAVRRFQAERHIEHYGYLSYETLAELDCPPPPPVYQPQLTTFDTGYITWPGKLRY